MTNASVLSSCASIRRNIKRSVAPEDQILRKTIGARSKLPSLTYSLPRTRGSCGAARGEPAAPESPAAAVEPPEPAVADGEKVVRLTKVRSRRFSAPRLDTPA